MKQFFIAFAFAVAGIFFGFDSIAQKKNTCIFHITSVKFKKPRTECQRGFGLCIRAHWDFFTANTGDPNCSFGLSFGEEHPRVEKNEIYAGVAFSKSKLWIAVPRQIGEMEEYKEEDLSYLPIEEKIVLYVNKKPYGTILPQKAPMKEEGEYLIYEFELSN